VTSGSLSGRVLDPSGAAVPGAAVELEDPLRGAQRQTVSGADGLYLFTLLPPSGYRVRVSAPGFAALALEGLSIGPGQARREDVTLPLAGVSETTEVAAAARPADAAGQGLTLESERIRSLPLNRRDFLQLALLAPGVAPPAQDSELSSRGAFAMHANGAREEFNQYLLDGVDNNDPYNNRFLLQPPVETIQEFRVETGGYGAEFGRSAGGQVNIITRSGTNELHGELYEYFRNRALDAGNFFEGERKARYQRNQFGGALGGPLRRNRAFFHGNFGGIVERQGLPRLGVVPTAAQRAGDLSGSSRPATDPFTQRPFPGNVIPASRIHPLAGRVLDLFPVSATGAFQGQPVLRDSNPQGSARFDQRFSARDELTLRYSYGLQNLFEPYAEDSRALPGFGNVVRNAGHNAMAHYTKTLSPWAVNSLRLGFTRSFRQVLPENHLVDVGRLWGVNWLNVRPRDYGYPSISVQGFSPVGDATPLPIERYSNSYQITEGLQLQAGRHVFKLGADVRRQEVNGFLD
jgi:hypothetical protein